MATPMQGFAVAMRVRYGREVARIAPFFVHAEPSSYVAIRRLVRRIDLCGQMGSRRHRAYARHIDDCNRVSMTYHEPMTTPWAAEALAAR